MEHEKIKSETYIGIEEGFGIVTKEPYVTLVIRDSKVQIVTQMTPEKAKQIGMWLIEKCEESLTDAQIMHWAKRANLDDEILAEILQDFRAFRHKHRVEIILPNEP